MRIDSSLASPLSLESPYEAIFGNLSRLYIHLAKDQTMPLGRYQYKMALLLCFLRPECFYSEKLYSSGNACINNTKGVQFLGVKQQRTVPN